MIANGGVFRMIPDNAEPVDANEIDKLIIRFQQLGASVELVFKDWIKYNPVPEYNQSCENNSFKFNWFL